MRRWILAAWLGSGAVASASPPQDGDGWRLVERVVAVVNGDIVLASDLDRGVAWSAAELANIADPAERTRRQAALPREILQLLVDDLLIAQAAAQRGVSVSDEEVDRAIAQIQTQNNLDAAALARALADKRVTLTDYRSDLRRTLLRFRMFQQIAGARLTIPDATVQTAYQAAKARDPSLGEFAAESARLRDELQMQALTAAGEQWLADERSRAHVELRL